jgi:hypothetical protein
MDPAILEAMNEYYKMKREYENKQQRLKERILRDNHLSKQEKIKRFQNLKTKCIHCKHEGGTVFSNENRTLKAICGNNSNPCELNIEIYIGPVYQLSDITKDIKNNMDLIKSKIIRSKLNLLFGYEEEDAIIKQFDKLKKDLEYFTKEYVYYQTMFIDIIDNKERFNKLQSDQISLYEEIQKFKAFISEFKVEQKDAIIKNAVEQYITIIQPLAKNIRELQYEYNAIEFDSTDNTYHLQQIPNTIASLEVNVDGDPKIISNKK